MAKVYVVTDNWCDYDDSSTNIVGIFDTPEAAEAGKAEYTQKVLNALTAQNIICGRCQCSKEYHNGGEFVALAKKEPKGNEDQRKAGWTNVLKEYRKAGRLCNDGVFHTPSPITKMNERQSIEIAEHEIGLIADV
jgi:hypothetical protein